MVRLIPKRLENAPPELLDVADQVSSAMVESVQENILKEFAAFGADDRAVKTLMIGTFELAYLKVLKMMEGG